ncbi:hypothetical protein JB92DRAFT_2828105 [Gautieria morchelliformis]|nr:hypothetical protein JB92DRAFT_2828105 [Gautieria morchelliformis]
MTVGELWTPVLPIGTTSSVSSHVSTVHVTVSSNAASHQPLSPSSHAASSTGNSPQLQDFQIFYTVSKDLKRNDSFSQTLSPILNGHARTPHVPARKCLREDMPGHPSGASLSSMLLLPASCSPSLDVLSVCGTSAQVGAWCPTGECLHEDVPRHPGGALWAAPDAATTCVVLPVIRQSILVVRRTGPAWWYSCSPCRCEAKSVWLSTKVQTWVARWSVRMQQSRQGMVKEEAAWSLRGVMLRSHIYWSISSWVT